MKENMVFCSECRSDITYTIKEKLLEGNLKGEKYRYNGKMAYCDNCKAEVYVPEINDYNLKSLYNAYRDKNGIISLKNILEIPEKYGIGKRPLSLLLGWGEQTFSRYCDGDMPTKQYSEILKKIHDDPQFYASLLENNKKNLKTIAAYEKSKRTVNDLLGIKTTQPPKINLVIAYLLNQCGDITPLALQKALYYVQGFNYAFYKTFLFQEDCEAWTHGPVYREIYNRYSEYHFDPIEGPQDFDISVFSATEKSVLDSVVKNICCYSGKVLENFTHRESPWIETRGDLPEHAGSNRIIDKELIGKYFIAVKGKYNMLTPSDIKSYTQSMFYQM